MLPGIRYWLNPLKINVNILFANYIYLLEALCLFVSIQLWFCFYFSWGLLQNLISVPTCHLTCQLFERHNRFLQETRFHDSLPENSYYLQWMLHLCTPTTTTRMDGCNLILNEYTASVFITLSHLILTCNYFRFGDYLYLEINGTAIGTCMVFPYANIFMTSLTFPFLCSFPFIPLIY